LEIHKVATKYEDPQLTDFLEGEFLKEQVRQNVKTRVSPIGYNIIYRL
jgi:hypothetical protein